MLRQPLSPPIRTLVALAVIASSIVSFVAPPSAVAQKTADDPTLDSVFFPAPREQRQRLVRAARALEEGQYSDAVIALGGLLSGEGAEDQDAVHQDYFLGATSQAGTRESVKAKAQQMLGGMNAEGRKLYELRFGPQARALLSRALAENDTQKLVDITRRFFHTSAGYEATVLLGRRHLGEGQPLAAAMHFQRLARWPQALKKFDPQLSLMLATAWLQAGMEEKALNTVLALKQRLPNAGLRIGGENVSLFAREQDALPWLKRWSEGVDLNRSLDQEQWVMHRGNPRRNGSTKGALPLLNERWRVPTVNNPEDEELVAAAKRQKRSQRLATISSLQPLAVNGHVIMRTPDTLWAVDFETGSRVWEWPWRPTARMNSSKPGSPRAAQLSQRMWDDASFGQMASDGDNLYFINDQEGADLTSGQTRRIAIPAGAFFVNGRQTGAAANNELMCLSLRREGAIRWSVGGKDGGFEPELAGVTFLGPPLPLQGRLYVLAESKSEIRLVVLNAQDGSLIWQQPLAHMENNMLARLPQRRMMGATPAFSDGVLICPTGIGAVVGLDISTRSLLWGYQYSSTYSGGRVNSIRYRRTKQTPKDRWVDATPLITDQWVLLTPPESNELHCLDLLTGAEAKWSPIKREDLLYVATAEDNIAVLVGKGEVQGIDLNTGEPAWNPLKLGDATPSGLGFVSDKHYFLPTTDKRILKISVETGEKVAEVETSRELGNLICFENNVISQGSKWVSAYYQRDFLRDEVATRLEQNADDLWALTRQCELLLQDEKYDEALVALRKTHQLQPDDPVIRTLLVDTLLRLLRTDFQTHAHLVDELDPLIENPQQRNEFARLREGLEQAGKIREAFEAVLELLPEGPESGQMEYVTDLLQVRRDRWAAARIARLGNAAEGEDKQRIADVVSALLDEALSAGTARELRDVLDRLGRHPEAKEARLALAGLLIQRDDLLAAELQLIGLDAGEGELAGRAVALQAELLTRAGLHAEAAGKYRRLASQWPDLELDAGSGAEVASKALSALSALSAKDAAGVRWPYGAVKSSSSAYRGQRSPYQRIYPIAMEQSQGDTSISVVADLRTNNLVIRDGWGRPRQTLPLTNGPRYYTTNYALMSGRRVGHLLLINLGYELVAIDTLRTGSEGLLWRKPLHDQPTTSTRTSINQIRSVQRAEPFGMSRRVAGDMSNRVLNIAGPSGAYGVVVYQKMHDLICADAITGEPIWVRSGMPLGAELLGDADTILVAPPNGGEAKLINAIDGEETGAAEIESLQSRWTSWGANTMSFKTVGANVELRLYNVLTKETLWEGVFPSSSKGALVQGDEIAVFEQSGKLSIISLKSGDVVLQQQLEKEPQLQRLQVLRSREQYLVAPSLPQTNDPDLTPMPAPLNTYSNLISGRIYALDRKTGERVWQSAVTMDGFSMPAGQPLESPVLLFVRNERKRNATTGRVQQTYSAVGVDRRDGSLVFREEHVVGSLGMYQMTAEPEKNTVTVVLENRRWTLDFTDELTPPKPPAQIGKRPPSAAEAARDAVRRATDALFRSVPLP